MINSYHSIIFGKKEDYLIKYYFAGKNFTSDPIEALNKNQAEELFYRHYSKSCLITKIQSQSEICDEISKELIQKIRDSFEKSKLEFNLGKIKKSA